MASKKIIFDPNNLIMAAGEFSKEAEKLKGKVYIEAGENYNEYRVCGKSLLGILSLDLSKPVVVKVCEADSYFLDNLPKYCSEYIEETEDTKNKLKQPLVWFNTEDKYVFFYRPNDINGVCSNWYKSTFKVENIKFNCVEQYMVYKKAMAFGDTKTAQQILDEDNPSMMKKLGRAVLNYNDDVWSKIRFNTVKEGIKEKFKQNKELKQWLLSCEGCKFVECSPTDKIWGIGIGIDDYKRCDENCWRG